MSGNYEKPVESAASYNGEKNSTNLSGSPQEKEK